MVIRAAIVQIPNRIDVLGGFTDIVSWLLGAVLSLAVRIGTSPIRIRAQGVNGNSPPLTLRVNDKPCEGVLAQVARQWLENNAGGRQFLVEICNPIPAGAGFGGSSQMAFAIIAALSKVQGLSLSRQELARQAFTLETTFDSCGWQDFSPGVCGGFQFATAKPAANCADLVPEYEAVPVRDAVAEELQQRSLVACTGKSRFSKGNLDHVKGRIERREPAALQAWEKLRDLARSGRDLLRNQSLPPAAIVDRLSELLAENWQAELDLTENAVQHPVLAALAPRLQRLGCGKLVGAGGGGHLFFCARSKSAREQAIRLLKAANIVPVNWSIAWEPAEICGSS